MTTQPPSKHYKRPAILPEVLDERLENLACTMGEIKGLLERHIESAAEQNLKVAGFDIRITATDGRVDKLETMLNTTQTQLQDFEKKIQPLIYQSKILAWLAGALGVSVIGFIWAILTHQIQFLP